MTASYTYNALGQRVGKIVNGQGTRFFHDAQGHLLGEYAANGQPIQEIVWLGDWPIGVIKNNTLYNVHTDHLGTPRKISRASDNQVIWTWESEAFGAGAPNQNPSGLGNFVFNLRFPGQYYDAETGLHYNYFRDYDPNHGRYIESDPIGLAGGINTYGYVGGNPVGAIDPNGLYDITAPEFPTFPSGKLPPAHRPLICPSIPFACAIVGIGAGIIVEITGIIDSDHDEDKELLNATCYDASWAIPELETLIKKRRKMYKDSGGGGP